MVLTARCHRRRNSLFSFFWEELTVSLKTSTQQVQDLRSTCRSLVYSRYYYSRKPGCWVTGISNMRRLVYFSMLRTLELSQRSHVNGQQSGKPVILHILRRTTLFLRLETSLPAKGIPKKAEITMKEWAEHYRPVKQRSKKKAGALPSAVSLRKQTYFRPAVACLRRKPEFASVFAG